MSATVALAALALVGACRQADRPVKLGLVLPLTDVGIQPMLLGARLAVEEINASGGIAGRPLELVELDDFGEPDSAVAVASRLYDSDVLGVIGSAYSGVTLAAAPIYNRGRRPLVQLSPSASAPAITGAGDFTFRICPSDKEYGPAVARWAYDSLGLKRAALLYVNDDYGRGFRASFSQEFLQRGGEVVEADPFLAQDPEVWAYLARIATKGRADFLVLASNLDEGVQVLRQVRAAGIRLPILAGDGLVGVETSGSLAEGVYLGTGYLAGIETRRNRRFVGAYRLKYPSARLPDQGSAATYDAVYLLRDAIAQAGPHREKVRDALAAIGNRSPEYQGVVGPIAFDRNGDVPGLGVIIGVVKGGRLVPAEE